MGRLADSSLGARYLAQNPWVLVASPAYLKAHAAPATPADVAEHPCLIYSTVQGDERWHFTGTSAGAHAGASAGASAEHSVPVRGPLRSNNLSLLLEAALEGMGLAILPWYVAFESVREHKLVALVTEYALPVQEMHAVFPSPKLLPSKVSSFIAFLQERFTPQWWERVA
jgi:DNA-binding transcriptional LysR family regulator